MKFRLQFLTIVLVTLCLGVYLQDEIQPNQQIVLKFQNTSLLLQDKESTVVQIEDLLAAKGAKKIEVNSLSENELKITYHSNNSIRDLEKALNELKDVDPDDYSTLPLKPADSDDHKEYDILISELKQTPIINWDFEGVEIISQNFKSDRYYQTKTPTSSFGLSSSQYDIRFYDDFLEFRRLEFKLSHKTYSIPEARAGPLS